MNSFGMRRHVGDTPQRGGIFISVMWVTIRGWSGGGRRYGNCIVRQNQDYFGGVFLRTRSRYGKICISEVLWVQDGVHYVGHGGNQLCTCSWNTDTIWRFGQSAINFYGWLWVVSGKELLYLMHGNVGAGWKNQML